MLGGGASSEGGVVAATDDGTSTALLVSIQLPVAGLHHIFNFAMRPANAHWDGVLGRVADLVLEVADELQEHLAGVDLGGNERKLRDLQACALRGLEDWRAKLQAAEEGLVRVERAKGQMNVMRECYFKELVQLKEQLHRKAEAERSGQHFHADDYNIFDPTDYSFGDEGDGILKQKAQLLQLRFDEHRERIMTLLDASQRRLETSKMLLERKDILLRGLMERHGYRDEVALEQKLASSAMVAATPQAPAATPEVVKTEARDESRANRQEPNTIFASASRLFARQLTRHFPKPRAAACDGGEIMADTPSGRDCVAAHSDHSGGKDEVERCACGSKDFTPTFRECRSCGAQRKAEALQEAPPARRGGFLFRGSSRLATLGSRRNSRSSTACSDGNAKGQAAHGQTSVTSVGPPWGMGDGSTQSDVGGPEVEEALALLSAQRMMPGGKKGGRRPSVVGDGPLLATQVLAELRAASTKAPRTVGAEAGSQCIVGAVEPLHDPPLLGGWAQVGQPAVAPEHGTERSDVAVPNQHVRPSLPTEVVRQGSHTSVRRPSKGPAQAGAASGLTKILQKHGVVTEQMPGLGGSSEQFSGADEAPDTQRPRVAIPPMSPRHNEQPRRRKPSHVMSSRTSTLQSDADMPGNDSFGFILSVAPAASSASYVDKAPSAGRGEAVPRSPASHGTRRRQSVM